VKRFYKDVLVTEERGITLDGRAVKTPAKAPLILPNIALAEAVADEWRAQGEEIDPHSMPCTGLSNAAIDHTSADPDRFAADLALYGETELLCYRAEEPFALVAKQNQDWNPLLGWAQARYDVSFTLVRGIMHQPQPPETLARLGEAVQSFTPFELAALSPLVTISGSLVIALALAEGAITPQAAFDAAHLDELWQEEQWGADDFALDARAVRRRDFLSAARFFDLARHGGGR
jgi:chaperone required for assembly of F1-ATPase